MRLNKFIAEAGVASRRGADRLIEEGKVTVNGEKAVVGMTVNPVKDHVKVGGKMLRVDTDKVHLLLYKPAGYLSTSNDPEGRPVVADLVPEYAGKRLYTIGRLDYTTEGLIILTNDGEFAAKVGHPSTGPEKTYHVRVRNVPDESALERLRAGIERVKTQPAKISILRSSKNTWLEVTLKEGRNRQIRQMFEKIGNPVVKLRRVRIGNITSQGLKPGQYRLLTPSEIARLKNG